MVEKDYLDLEAVMPVTLFSRAIAKKTQEYAKKRIPFDEPCARLDFLDRVEAAEKESERRHGFVKVSEIKVEIGDLDKYGKADLFELEEDQEDVQDRVIEGSRTQVIIGHTLSYRCKKRGHGISLFIPITEYNKKDKKIKE